MKGNEMCRTHTRTRNCSLFERISLGKIQSFAVNASRVTWVLDESGGVSKTSRPSLSFFKWNST